MSKHSKKIQNKLNHIFNQSENVENILESAESFYAQKNYSEAVKLYEKAAAFENVNPVVFFYLGHAYQHGEGVKIDLIQAFDYYEEAAKHGIPQALNNLAYFYQNGLVVERDSEKAVRLCREATLKLNELQNKLYKLQLEHESLTENYYASIKLIENANERVKLLENKSSQTEKASEKLRNENGSLKDEIIKFKNQYNYSSSQNALLVADNQKLEERLNHSEQLIADKDALINSLNSQIVELRKNGEEISEKYFEFVRSVEKLQGENEALVTSLKKSEEEYKNILIRNAQLVDQLKTKEQDHSSLMQRYISVNETYNHINSEFEIEKKAKKDVESQFLRVSNEKDFLEKTIAQNNDEHGLKEESLNEKIKKLNQLKVKLLIIIGALGGGLVATLIILIIFLFNF
ncbi:MAG: hypothetical protein ACI4HM_09425 [Ruminococcus sp.]